MTQKQAFQTGQKLLLILWRKKTRNIPDHEHRQYNILNREAGGRAAPAPNLSEVVHMSTYEEL